MKRIRVCHLQELEQPCSLEVQLTDGEEISGIFVVKVNDQVRAYRNSCPHTGAPLNWLPDQFLDHMGELIQCSIHGAQFRPDSGECIHGPCLGEYLHRLDIEIRQNEVYVTYPAS